MLHNSVAVTQGNKHIIKGIDNKSFLHTVFM